LATKLDLEGVYWHQQWEVEPGLVTPGRNSVAQLLKLVDFPDRLDGKRVLDIGAWNGCFSFECERRGAAEVLAIGPEPSAATGFDRLKSFLGSKVSYQFGSIYDLSPQALGTFDIVLCFGVLYHLRYPLLGLDNCKRVAKESLYLESSCIDHDLLINGKSYPLEAVNPSLADTAISQFFRLDELNADPSNWFSPNEKCLRDMLLSSGFEPTVVRSTGVRIYAHAKVKPGMPEFLTIGSGENVYYDLFLRKYFGEKAEWTK